MGIDCKVKMVNEAEDMLTEFQDYLSEKRFF